MAYSDFSLKRAVDQLGLTIGPRSDLLAGVEAVALSPLMRIVLERWAPQALEVNTAKARAELIISPILMEAALLAGEGIGVYSGVALDVDGDLGLFGPSDFLIARKAGPFLMGSPLMVVVQAKDDDIVANLGRCVAEMVAARLSIERDGQSETGILGAVTTGGLWLFLRLDGAAVTFDTRERSLSGAGILLAYLAAIGSAPPPALSLTKPLISLNRG